MKRFSIAFVVIALVLAMGGCSDNDGSDDAGGASAATEVGNGGGGETAAMSDEEFAETAVGVCDIFAADLEASLTARESTGFELDAPYRTAAASMRDLGLSEESAPDAAALVMGLDEAAEAQAEFADVLETAMDDAGMPGAGFMATEGGTVYLTEGGLENVVDSGIDPEVYLATQEADEAVDDAAERLGLRSCQPTAIRAALVTGGGDEDTDAVTRTDDGVTTTTAEIAAAVPGDAAVTDTIEFDRLGYEPWGIAVSDDAVWVANNDDALYRVDLESLTVTDTIEVESPQGVAVADDAIWVANGDDVSRIDRESLTVTDTFELGEDKDATEVAIGGGFVWVLSPGEDLDAASSESEPIPTVVSRPGSVSRIDTATGSVTSFRFTDPRGLAVGEGAVWVGDRDDGTVSRLDLETGIVTDTIDVGDEPNAVAVGGGAVWVTDVDEDVVVRIDAETLGVTASIELDEPGGIAVSGDSVWVTEIHDDVVVRIDLETVSVTDTIDVGFDAEPQAVAVGGDAVWVANYGPNTVARIG